MSQRLVPSDRLPDYGFTIGNAQRKHLEAAGLFPKRVETTERTHAYIEDELIAHAKNKIAERDTKLGQRDDGTLTSVVGQ